MIHPARSTLWAALAALILLATGCAKTHVATDSSPNGRWQAFRSTYCVPPAEPGLMLKASLYYTRTQPTRRTNRTVLTLWGNFDGPVRLDLAAGMGKILAHIREDDTGLLVFYPSDNTAYTHADPVLGATRLGMPFPFSLIELARVCAGDFSGLVPDAPGKIMEQDGGFAYALKKGRIASVTLDNAGRPVRLDGSTSAGRRWTLLVERFDDADRPKRLALSLEDGEKGVLHIKTRELKVTAWNIEALDLPLPDEVAVRRLETVGARQQ